MPRSMAGPARRGLRAAAAMTAVLLAAGGAALAGAGAASADVNSWQQLIAVSSLYNLDVNGASTSAYAPIDVWYNTGGANQQFSYPDQNGQVAQIINENSGMCITTDGVAGDGLFQLPCQNAGNQQWEAETWTAWWNPGKTMVTFLNPWSGLVMDIYDDSYSPGATVDAWYPNGGLNQSFLLPGCSGAACS
jgi:hypothetical protein